MASNGEKQEEEEEHTLMPQHCVADAVCTFLDQHFPDEASLSSAKLLLEEAQGRNALLQKEQDHLENCVPEVVRGALGDAEEALQTLAALEARRTALHAALQDHTGSQRVAVIELTELNAEVSRLEQVRRYVEIVLRVENLSTKALQALGVSHTDAISSCMALVDVRQALREVDECKNLRAFVNGRVALLLNRIKDQTLATFQSALKGLNWPTTKTREQLIEAENRGRGRGEGQNAFHAFSVAFEQLVSLQFALEENCLSSSIHTLWVMDLLLDPLLLRFRYHFEGKKETNQLDKPEWCFTYILRILRDHTPFLLTVVQPMLDEFGFNVDAKLDFARGLVEAVKSKLRRDFPKILKRNDDCLLLHTVGESVSFQKALQSEFPPRVPVPVCLDVFVEEERWVERWINAERHWGGERIDDLLRSANAWEAQYATLPDVDELKPTRSAAGLMSLLHTVTERYELLPNRAYQHRMVMDVQFSFLHEYLREIQVVFSQDLKMMAHANEWPLYCGLMNSANYCAAVLRDWGEQLFFLELQEYVLTTQDEEGVTERGVETTVFENCIEAFEKLVEEMLQNVVSVTTARFKQGIRSYRKKRFWYATPTEGSSANLDVSAELCDALGSLRGYLSSLESSLSKTLFGPFWRRLAQSLNLLIFESVVEGTPFNEGGALQFRRDMQTLFLLFRFYSQRPENLFKDIKEACLVLCMPASELESFSEALASTEDPSYVLESKGIHRLSSDVVQKLCTQRTR